MRGILFGDNYVELDSRTHGNSFSCGRDGMVMSWDSRAVALFSERMSKLDAPVVWDIGAGLGSYTLLATLHPNAHVVAFEPNPAVFEVLASNVKLNHLEDRVTLMPYAVSDTTGTAVLQVPVNSFYSGLATIGDMQRTENYEPVEVETCHLDGLPLGHVDLIKIDTEGAELLVLRGGENTIERRQPDILLEYYAPNTHQFGYEPEEIVELLRSWGYKHFDRQGDDLWATT